MSDFTKNEKLGHWSVDAALAVLAGGLLCVGLYMAFYKAPLVSHSGLHWWSQKIFYIHLPAAWGALSGLLLVLIGSIAFLLTRRVRWDSFAVGASETCFVYATLVMIVGPIWAKPSWGVYWDWQNARLMSFFALWMLLGAYFVLRNYGGADRQLRVATASLGIIAALSVPFVYLSVKVGAPVHPRPDEVEVSRWAWITVHVCNVSFFFLFLLLMRIRRRLEEQKDQLKQIKMRLQELEI